GGAARAMYDPVLGKLKEIASPGLQGSGSKEEGQLIGTVRPTALPPGRGVLVSRRFGQQMVQTAWVPPETMSAETASTETTDRETTSAETVSGSPEQ
ncbi:hypothetical protein, partial [Actinophytocola sp.]|uniref:hypothetical protein n=1 Tax=Actinophytocola sp. TaxID=1872138 RepID=UPI0025BDE4E2